MSEVTCRITDTGLHLKDKEWVAEITLLHLQVQNFSHVTYNQSAISHFLLSS